MVNLNKLLIVAIIAVAVVAIAGMANAASVTVTPDKVQINGAYIGIPTAVVSEFQIDGYDYTLIPDGTYTLLGTIKNDGTSAATVDFGWGSKVFGTVTVPASSTVSFAVPFTGSSIGSKVVGVDEGYSKIDLTALDYVNAPDNTDHTWDLGPMSGKVSVFTPVVSIDNTTIYWGPMTGQVMNFTPEISYGPTEQGLMSGAVSIYSNGTMNYNGVPTYAVNIH